MGKIMRVIPLIVIPTLVFSLIESLLVLPNHLSHVKLEKQSKRRWRRAWQKIQDRVADGLDWVMISAPTGRRSRRPSSGAT